MFSFLYHYQYFYQTSLYIWVTRRMCYKKPSRAPEFTPKVFWWGPYCPSFYLFVLSYYVSTYWVRYDFRIKTMLGLSLPPVVCMGFMFFLRYVCVCLRIVVSNTYCVVFLFLFVLCFVYPMLPVSLGYPFLIAPSVFSDVYLTVLWIFHPSQTGSTLQFEKRASQKQVVSYTIPRR